MKTAVIQQNARSPPLNGTSNPVKIHSEYSPLSTKKTVLYQIIDLTKSEDDSDSQKSEMQNEKNETNCERLEVNRSALYSCKTVSTLNNANDNLKHINDPKTDVTEINAVDNNYKTQSATANPPKITKSVNNDDSRVTGGGDRANRAKQKFLESQLTTSEKIPLVKKLSGNSPRKISFKIRNGPIPNRRTSSNSVRTTTKLNGSKVAELTQKFNEMIKEKDGILNQPKFAKVIEKIQNKASDSNSSTPSSTLTPGTSFKIVTKIKPSAKKKMNLKKKSASESAADSDRSSSSRKTVHRVKSDSHSRKRNSIKKKRKPSPMEKVEPKDVSEKEFLEKIKHFENTTNATKTYPKAEEVKEQSVPERIKPAIPAKPVIPEKKLSLTMTKNVVIREGKPKIKMLNPNATEVSNSSDDAGLESNRKNIYEKFKFRPNFLKGSKLQLLKHVEPISETTELLNLIDNEDLANRLINDISSKFVEVNSAEDEIYQKISLNLTPNESFLWKKDQTYYNVSELNVDSPNEESHEPISPSVDLLFKKTDLLLETKKQEIAESLKKEKREVEAVNIAVIAELSEKDDLIVAEAINLEAVNNFEKKIEEDDYEILEPFRETTEIGSEQFNSLTKIRSCPLPEVLAGGEENIYQCLFELRSHPEGDDCSVQNYEYCANKIPEQRTRGDGDSDDGYDYCRGPPMSPPRLLIASKIQQQPLPEPNKGSIPKSYVAKSESNASSIGYEKIYEKIPADANKAPAKSKKQLSYTQSTNSYDTLNGNENLYDVIKHPDSTSVNNCYESIPNSPHSGVKMRSKVNISPGKRLSFDTVSNFSHSTISSEQKTNSLYGQRSVVSIIGAQEPVCYGPATSEVSLSDRSDDWVDVSEAEDRTNDNTVVIIRERAARGRKSPTSWSQKVRHQWHKSPKKSETVLISSPSMVYMATTHKCSYYSSNDECREATARNDHVNLESVYAATRSSEPRRHIRGLILLRLRIGGPASEEQEINAFIGGDSSDSEHYYESLHLANDVSTTAGVASRPPAYDEDDDFDSFDSDSDTDTPRIKEDENKADVESSTLPAPPSSNVYTLTKFASAAGKKMREIKRNLTKSAKKRYSGSSESTKSPSSNPTSPKSPMSPSNSLLSRLYEPRILRQKSKVSTNPNDNLYENTNFSPSSHPTNESSPKSGGKIYGSQQSIYPVTLPPNINYDSATQLNIELKNALNVKRLSMSKGSADIYQPTSPLLNSQVDKNEERTEKANAMSRKTYFSFKAKFRRCTSMVVDNVADVPSALKITNSTFYLTDTVDVDSGFSNCSDSGQTVTSSSTEAILPTAPLRKDKSKSIIDKENIDSNSGKDYSTASNGRNDNPSPNDQNKRKGRPLVPPPPPPEGGDLKRLFPSFSKKEKHSNSSTSWYAECGLFDAVNRKQGIPNGCKERPSSTSWYAEVGLYEAGNVSSSSGASSSTSMSSPSHPPPPPPAHGRFQQEPLYQFYNAAKVESVCRERTSDSDSDGYEEITDLKNGERTVLRPSAMALVSPLKGPSRTLWCEIPEVVNSAVLSSLSSNQKKLQEAKFEIITSEASYLNSLTVLEKYFMNYPGFKDELLISKVEHNILFGTILPVKQCSEQLMNELEECWQDNILLYGMADIVKKYAEKNFHVYITYCENQIFLVKTLQKLKANPTFAAILSTLESQPACHGLSLHSFLMLPMQRATRLPLLVDAVLKNLEPNDDEYQIFMDTLATLNHFVSQCNEGARNMERVDEMFRIASYLDFPSNLNNPPDLAPTCIRSENTGKVVKPKRWLVRSGELTQFMWRGDEVSKLTFGKKFTKIPISLFLFTDILIIAKKYSDESYTAIDYCNRSLIEMSPGDVMGQLNLKETAGKFTMLLTLLENNEKKTVEMLLSCTSETDRQRWIEAFSAPTSNNPEETVYEGWDCPQVAAIYPYQPMQPDELGLQEGDIVNVNKKMADGWYHGERIRDGEVGWFPGNYTREIASPHVRARNLRQRYRLLALSGSYLGQRKK